MYAFLPILLEVIFVLLKPQELYESLTLIQPLYTIPGLIGLGFVFDSGRYGLGAKRMIGAPYIWYALSFFGWCLLTILVKAPAALMAQAIQFGTSMLIAMALAHSLQQLPLYKMFGISMLAIGNLLSFVGVHQATAPFRCHWIDPVDRTILHYEDQACPGPEQVDECYKDEESRSRDYVCEHSGLMGTASVSGRIRFRGNLEDPNELSLTVGVGFPFAVAMYQSKKTVLRFLIMAVSFGLIALCVFYSQSRGGQLVLMIVLGTFFVKRFGWKVGGLVGGLFGGPLMVLAALKGSRSESEAEGSALERVECLQVGIDLVKSSPLIGVGKGQFGEYHFLTAHNSYVLAAAETGIIGFFLWSAVIYLAVKVPIASLRALKGVEGKDAEQTRIWATALLASMIGAVVGSFFLSFSFHAILWIYIGMSGAFAGVTRKVVPGFRVRLSGMEMGAILGANIALLTAIFAYAKYKLG